MTKNTLKVEQPSLDRLGKIFAAHPMRPMDDLLNFGLGGRLELWLRIHGGPFVLTVRLCLTQRYGPNTKSLTIDGMLWLHGKGRDGCCQTNSIQSEFAATRRSLC